MELQDFRFKGAPLYWSLELADPRYASLQMLLAKFLEEWGYDHKSLGWAVNPVNKKTGVPYFDPQYDHIVAPYRKNFLIVIDRSFNEIFGPHAVRLMYRSWQIDNDLVWVAICQIEAMWHSDERMQTALQQAISAGELWQSPKTAETIVLL